MGGPFSFKKLVVISSVTIAVFTSYKYFSSLKEHYGLVIELDSMHEKLSGLNNEKNNALGKIEGQKQVLQDLKGQNQNLTEDLKVAQNDLSKANDELFKAKDSLGKIEARALNLEQENTQLRTDNGKLKIDADALIQENASLKVKLSSIQELKKTIRELKLQARQVGKAIITKAVTPQNINVATEGNRGFVIKEGKSTYSAQVNIQVVPAPGQ